MYKKWKQFLKEITDKELEVIQDRIGPNLDAKKQSFDDIFHGKMRVLLPQSIEKKMTNFTYENSIREITITVQQMLGLVFDRNTKIMKSTKIKNGISIFDFLKDVIKFKNNIDLFTKKYYQPTEDFDGKFAYDAIVAEIKQNFSSNLERSVETLIDSMTKDYNAFGQITTLRIIATRHPIDVLRMADFKGMTSCHSPPSSREMSTSYYRCAVQEAKGHGFVAYVVSQQNLDKINLDDDEIFLDSRRENAGKITPLSRIRLRKIVVTTNDDRQVSLFSPENRVYGDQAYAAPLLQIVRSWAKEVQKPKVEKLEEIGGIKSAQMYSTWSDHGSTSQAEVDLLYKIGVSISKDKILRRYAEEEKGTRSQENTINTNNIQQQLDQYISEHPFIESVDWSVREITYDFDDDVDGAETEESIEINSISLYTDFDFLGEENNYLLCGLLKAISLSGEKNIKDLEDSYRLSENVRSYLQNLSREECNEAEGHLRAFRKRIKQAILSNNNYSVYSDNCDYGSDYIHNILRISNSDEMHNFDDMAAEIESAINLDYKEEYKKLVERYIISNGIIKIDGFDDTKDDSGLSISVNRNAEQICYDIEFTIDLGDEVKDIVQSYISEKRRLEKLEDEHNWSERERIGKERFPNVIKHVFRNLVRNIGFLPKIKESINAEDFYENLKKNVEKNDPTLLNRIIENKDELIRYYEYVENTVNNNEDKEKDEIYDIAIWAIKEREPTGIMKDIVKTTGDIISSVFRQNLATAYRKLEFLPEITVGFAPSWCRVEFSVDYYNTDRQHEPVKAFIEMVKQNKNVFDQYLHNIIIEALQKAIVKLKRLKESKQKSRILIRLNG